MSPMTEETNEPELAGDIVSTYAAELEVEVDRLLIREELIQAEGARFLKLVSQHAENGEPDADGSRSRQLLQDASTRLGALLEYLVTEAGGATVRDDVTNIPLRPMIEQVFATQRIVNHATNAVLRISLETEAIVWFPVRLRQILHNLLGNALRFGDPRKGETRVTVAIRGSDGRFELRVSDNGAGFSTDQADAIANLTHREEQRRSSHPRLGLSVVQYLVNQCCGTVDLQSSYTNGTSVLVFLPRYDVGDYVESNHD
jgi:signal transduction histidine kinase